MGFPEANVLHIEIFKAHPKRMSEEASGNKV